MSHFFIAVGVVIAVIAVAAPIAAACLVSVASRREESKHSLSGQPPGPITKAARRLLAYRSQTGTGSPSLISGDDLRARALSSATRGRADQRDDWHAPSAIEPVPIRLAPTAAAQERREPAGTHAA
jgi:hypothetical protein